MKLRHLVLGAGVLIVILLTVNMLRSLSSDALAMAVGLLFGVFAGVPTALLVLASNRRQGLQDDDDDEYTPVQPRRYRRLPGDDLPLPYEPPVIVVAAPLLPTGSTEGPIDGRYRIIGEREEDDDWDR